MVAFQNDVSYGVIDVVNRVAANGVESIRGINHRRKVRLARITWRLLVLMFDESRAVNDFRFRRFVLKNNLQALGVGAEVSGIRLRVEIERGRGSSASIRSIQDLNDVNRRYVQHDFSIHDSVRGRLRFNDKLSSLKGRGRGQGLHGEMDDLSLSLRESQMGLIDLN